MTLTLNVNYDMIRIKQQTKYLGQRSLRSKVTNTHKTDQLLYPNCQVVSDIGLLFCSPWRLLLFYN